MRRLYPAVSLLATLAATAATAGQVLSPQDDRRPPLLTHVATGARSVRLPYLYQKLENRKYGATFRALFSMSPELPAWVQRYITMSDGVQIPGELVMLDGRRFELYKVCQPHNCPGNYLFVLFKPGGAHGWAVTTQDGANIRFYGSPDESMQEFLSRATDQF